MIAAEANHFERALKSADALKRGARHEHRLVQVYTVCYGNLVTCSVANERRRDAADVAITTSFAVANLTHFYVESREIDSEGKAVPLPPSQAAMQGEVRQIA